MIFFILGLCSFNSMAETYSLKLCDNCYSYSEFESKAKKYANFNQTIVVHIYNSKSDEIRKFQVVMRQQILPNGEILFPVFASEYEVEQALRDDVTTFFEEKEAVGETLLSTMNSTMTMEEMWEVRVPESIARSPWDLVGRGYLLSSLSDHLNPSHPDSVWLQNSLLANRLAAYAELAIRLGLTKFLDFDQLPFNQVTLTFESGAEMIFSFQVAGGKFWDLQFTAMYPIIDSEGNIVANNSNDLIGSKDFTGGYRFGNGAGASIDRYGFEDSVLRANWSIRDFSGTSSGNGTRTCVRTYYEGQLIHATCSMY